jgi:hypothetical protein
MKVICDEMKLSWIPCLHTYGYDKIKNKLEEDELELLWDIFGTYKSTLKKGTQVCDEVGKYMYILKRTTPRTFYITIIKD